MDASNPNNLTNEIAKIAICTICAQLYTNNEKAPITLECGHTFCTRCLEIRENQPTGLTCPTCGTRIWRPLAQLEKNRQFIDLLNEIGLIQRDLEVAISSTGVETSESELRTAVDTSSTDAVDGDEMPQMVVRNEAMDEAREMLNTYEEMITTYSNIIGRLQQLMTNYRGNEREVSRTVLRIMNVLREQVYSISRLHTMLNRLGMMQVQVQQQQMVPMLPNEVMEDLNIQEILMRQFERRDPTPPANAIIVQANAPVPAILNDDNEEERFGDPGENAERFQTLAENVEERFQTLAENAEERIQTLAEEALERFQTIGQHLAVGSLDPNFDNLSVSSSDEDVVSDHSNLRTAVSETQTAVSEAQTAVSDTNVSTGANTTESQLDPSDNNVE